MNHSFSQFKAREEGLISGGAYVEENGRCVAPHAMHIGLGEWP